ncbi:hypothetical protein BDM02DRAFT_2277222 [Thelephora ganbajun]|uniref:Uncharacterized protein n=1 Tax=Thelephora ganbajun TaxID=370292 RepID=A0ACB6ZF44_THEGA|nr:hypothetical protein BDM02DRAFT_2277222 [Thelephora ganbajun]
MEVVAVPAPRPARSTSTEKRAKMPTKPISEQVFATSVERKWDDQTSEPTEAKQPPAAELHATNNSCSVEANPPTAVSSSVDHVVEAEVVVTSAQGLHDMDVEPDKSDPIVAESPMKVQTVGSVTALPARIRELAELEEPHPLEMNPDDGESLEGGIRGFAPLQPIMDRMPVGISTPKERLGVSAGKEATVQSTPAMLPRGPQQTGQMTFRKPKVTFATTPFKETEAVRSVQSEITPRSGVQRRTIFEDDVFGTNGAWKLTPAKNSDKHFALIGVLNDIQDVIVKKITHQFEVAEEEARFARNDVHNEALTDFKKMHSQRAVQFNALVDLETAYATRERELVVAYEATLAVNTEILGHVRQKIREHDERNLVGRLPKTLRKSPISALMNSYLK